MRYCAQIALSLKLVSDNFNEFCKGTPGSIPSLFVCYAPVLYTVQ